MKHWKKILLLLVALITVLALSVSLAACGEDGGSEDAGGNAATGEQTSYTVTVKTAGGMAMEGVSVAVYSDSTLKDLQAHAETNDSGVANVQLAAADGYAIVLSGVPNGYALEASYPLNSTNVEINLVSSLLKGESLNGRKLNVGEVMPDFTVTAPDGTSYTLSEVLKGKDMVLVNVFYTTCGPCVNEFPYLEQAYQMYKDKVEVLAINSYVGDTNESVAAFQSSMGLSFPMAKCPNEWGTFGTPGYPTSVIVDRYGVITLIEVGGITSLRPFTSIFETMTGDDYEQKLYNSADELLIIPTPTYEMADSDTVSAILGTTELPITYAPETGDSAKYSWPFIETEKNGEACLKASNQGIDDSYAIMYMEFELKAGQALGFDYLSSSENGGDILYVIAGTERDEKSEGTNVYSISGYDEEEQWKSCYPTVAMYDGKYWVALCYQKDGGNAAADDTVYVKNVRIVSAEDVDSATHLPQMAATTQDGFVYEYVDIVLNKQDGYYHVGTANGPLLFVNLMGSTQFSEEDSIWNMAYNGEVVVDGVNYVEELENYAWFANNSKIPGHAPITEEWFALLQKVDQALGFDDADDMEWMKACVYYQNYGTDEQVEDIIKGLAPFCAYEAKLGKNVETNVFNIDRQIIPRSFYAEFIPNRSGVYRFTSRSESQNGLVGWIHNANKEILFENINTLERNFLEEDQVSMTCYMEAGTPYYISMNYADPNELGLIYYDVEFMGTSYSRLVSCSPGPFTAALTPDGQTLGYVVAAGIDVVLGDDGVYYHDLGEGKKGSKIYLDLVNSTSAHTVPILSKGNYRGLIDRGYFDFGKNEMDLEVLTYLYNAEGDTEKAIELMAKAWTGLDLTLTESDIEKLSQEDKEKRAEQQAEFDDLYESYAVDEVLAGKYHGTGEDYSDLMRTLESKMIRDGSALNGCVVVTEEIAEVLQQFMDHHTFKGVDTAWRKFCYYYDNLG